MTISLLTMLLTGSPALHLDILLKPHTGVEKTKTALTEMLVNRSDRRVVLTGNPAADCCFSIHLRNKSENDIQSETDAGFIQIDELPIPVFQTLAPGDPPWNSTGTSSPT